MPVCVYVSITVGVHLCVFLIFNFYFIPKEILLCIYPIQACPSSGGQARSSGQPFLYSARGPTSVVVVTGQMTIFYTTIVYTRASVCVCVCVCVCARVPGGQ